MLGIKEIIEFICPKLNEFVLLIENEIKTDEELSKLVNKYYNDKCVNINNTNESLDEIDSFDNKDFKLFDTLKQSINFTYSLNDDFSQNYLSFVKLDSSITFTNKPMKESLFSNLKNIRPFQENNDKLNSILLLYSILKVLFLLF